MQSYMILDRYFDEIRPDVVVWQFSPGDVSDNSYAAESGSLGNRMTRPYWIDGEIQHRFPSDNLLIRHSLAVRWLATKGAIAMRRLSGGGMNAKLRRRPELLTDALATTDEIIGLIQNRVGAVPIVAFEVAHEQWLGSGLSDVVHLRGIHMVKGVTDSIEAARSRGIIVDGAPYDTHWSSGGHQIAGQMVIATLEELDLVQPVSPTTDR